MDDVAVTELVVVGTRGEGQQHALLVLPPQVLEAEELLQGLAPPLVLGHLRRVRPQAGPPAVREQQGPPQRIVLGQAPPVTAFHTYVRLPCACTCVCVRCVSCRVVCGSDVPANKSGAEREVVVGEIGEDA